MVGGYNPFGQLGDGTDSESESDVTVSGIAGGWHHGLALGANAAGSRH